MHFSIFSFEGEFSSKFIYWLFLLQQKCNFTHNYRLSRKHKPEEEKNKCCHIPENRVKNLSNPLVSSLIITCNLLSVCIVQLFFLQLFLLDDRVSFAPLYFFMFFLCGKETEFLCVCLFDIAQIFSTKNQQLNEKLHGILYFFDIQLFYRFWEFFALLLSKCGFSLLRFT